MADISNTLLQMQNDYNNQIFAREDTAVQRRVADLKAAGLSPILAANGYGAASGGQSQSPSQALNVALDYIVGQQQAQASMQGALASQMSSQAAMANAMVRSQELAVQQDYNNRYLDIYSQLVASQIAYNEANAGKVGSEGKMLDYNYDWYVAKDLPTTFQFNSGSTPTLAKYVDKNALGTAIANDVVSMLDESGAKRNLVFKVDNAIKNASSNLFEKINRPASETRNPNKIYKK